MSIQAGPDPFKPPRREDYDEGSFGDVRYEWAVDRYMMERSAPYAAAVASDGKLQNKDKIDYIGNGVQAT